MTVRLSLVAALVVALLGCEASSPSRVCTALDQVITQAKALDMAKVHQEIASKSNGTNPA